MSSGIQHDRKALFILAALLIVVGLVQAQNMFGFPYYQHDEGTHIANGWSIATTGELSPYTYSYEDPPVGTMLLAAWNLATGGPSAFGFPVNSGRVLMLILHVITTGLLFMLTRKLANSTLAAVVATLVFAFSPLAVSLQRVVLLENIMIVWLLASFYLVVGEDRTLMHYLGSALLFGLAVLSKGSALFFLPALLYVILATSHQHHRRFASSMWVALAVFMVSFYPLYAQMKEELFPEGSALGGDFPHVSLIERLGDRGPSTGRPLDYANGLSEAFDEWVNLSNATADPVLIYGGLIAAVFVALIAIDKRELRALVAMLLAVAGVLVLGGPVYNIDVILLLPFLAMAVGIVVGKIVDVLNHGNDYNILQSALVLGALALLLYPFWSFNANRLDIYLEDQVDGQLRAADWVTENLPNDAVIITDNYAFTHLRETHPNTHNYWRIDTDPAVKFTILRDDQCNIDYLITTPQVFSDMQTFNLDLMRRSIENSRILKTYDNNGWPVEIRQVDRTRCAPRLASDTGVE